MLTWTKQLTAWENCPFQHNKRFAITHVSLQTTICWVDGNRILVPYSIQKRKKEQNNLNRWDLGLDGNVQDETELLQSLNSRRCNLSHLYFQGVALDQQYSSQVRPVHHILQISYISIRWNPLKRKSPSHVPSVFGLVPHTGAVPWMRFPRCSLDASTV